MRTQQEILTKYKYGGVLVFSQCLSFFFLLIFGFSGCFKISFFELQDASAAAAHAKEKLMQRQEKLDVIIYFLVLEYFFFVYNYLVLTPD